MSQWKLEITPNAIKHLRYWQNTDAKKYQRIKLLLDSVLDNPKVGVGKPEALKHEFSGYWSRRIDEKIV